jgi:hypothetical protein
MLGVATVIPNVAIVILSEDSRRPLSVMSETQRMAKWVRPLPRGEGGPRRRFLQASRAG